MGRKKLHEALKIKEVDQFPSRVSGYCNWESIKLIKSHLSPKQLDLFRATCFGHFLDVSDMVLSGQFCHHILLRECHVRDADDTPTALWFYVGNGVIRFSAVEFCLVTGLTFGDYSQSPSEIAKHMDERLRRSYFQDSKVPVKMFADWFRNLGPNNNVSDDDMVKLALVLFLEMTLVGKDDRNAIQYWALQLVDDLDAFNKFPWGSFIYTRTFNSLSTCLVGRDDKFKERLESPAKRKMERYNVYGFVTAFQVWAIEAIPKWAMLGHASRVNNVTPRILNWKCTGIPTYVELYDNIFKYKNITIYKILAPFDEEARKPYWAGINQSHFPIDPVIVSPEEYDCGVDDDVQGDVQDDTEDNVLHNVERDAKRKFDDGGDHIRHSHVSGDMRKWVNPTTVKKDRVGSKKKGWKRFKELEIRLEKMQTQQDECWHKVHDEMASMKCSLMNEMRIGFLRLTELICKSNNDKTCQNVATDLINLSQDDNIQFEPPTVHRVLQSPELNKVNSEPRYDVQQLTRPSKLTIKVTRDRKWLTCTDIDPTAKRPKKLKMPDIGKDSLLDEDVVRSMNSWINDNKNTCMYTGLLEAKPHWFEILLSEVGWLDGDHMETYCRLMRQRAFFSPQLYNHNIVLLDYTFMMKIQGRWSLLVQSTEQFKHETYKWDSEMTDYVIGKKPVEAWEHWRKVNVILFPANVNENHWVAIAVHSKERVIKVYDSFPSINSVMEIPEWTSCLRMMLPSLLVHTMPDIYTDASPFAVQRPEKDIPNQGNRSDSGIFALKFLEYLWAGKRFDFEANDGATLRVKIAIEIFKNSKQVSSNNVVEGNLDENDGN